MEENIYGHKKKVEFILNAIKNYSISDSKPFSEIKVLDFGCGNGTAVSYEIAALGVQLTGIDFHSESIEFARANNPFPNAKFIQGNEDTASKLGEYFDIIVYSDIIEHLPDPELVMKKIGNVHRDGGIIVGSLPNGYGPFEVEKFIIKWTGLQWFVAKASRIKRTFANKGREKIDRVPYNAESSHCQFFRLRDFRTLLRDTGYDLLRLSNGAFLGGPLSEHFLGFGRFIDWNVSMADKLPPYLVSTWYFVAKKKQGARI